MNIILLVNILILCSVVQSFIPSSLIEEIIDNVPNYESFLDRSSSTITHDEIIQYGLAQSIADYFKSKSFGKSRIIDSKYNNEYREIKNIYKDYYGLLYFVKVKPDLYKHLEEELKPNVAVVDLDTDTKDNPDYHFDAERLKQANQLVISKTNEVYSALSSKDYKNARKLAARILHTIQDFYSHSNWVENGNTDINKKIGTADFNNLDIMSTNTPNPCLSNCTKVTKTCSTLITILNNLLKKVFNKTILRCPIVYYKCYGNIKTKQLLSGYYSDQKLSNGDSVPKPAGLNKCSHGGISDDTSNTEATGGINKDTGFFFFSPHAYLHLNAANLAIQHTRYFFNEIRKKIGDTEFVNYLSL